MKFKPRDAWPDLDKSDAIVVMRITDGQKTYEASCDMSFLQSEEAWRLFLALAPAAIDVGRWPVPFIITKTSVFTEMPKLIEGLLDVPYVFQGTLRQLVANRPPHEMLERIHKSGSWELLELEAGKWEKAAESRLDFLESHF